MLWQSFCFMVDPSTKVHPSWHSSLGPIDGKSSQQTSPGRSKTSFEGYGANQKTQECALVISWRRHLLIQYLQVDEELGRQMAQMKLIVQGTPGSSAGYGMHPLNNNTVSRSRLQPGAGPTARTMYNPRRPPLRPGQEYKSATIWSTERCPDHILPYSAMESNQWPIERAGSFIPRFQTTRDHRRVMPRLRLSRECTSMRNYITAGNHTW